MKGNFVYILLREAKFTVIFIYRYTNLSVMASLMLCLCDRFLHEKYKNLVFFLLKHNVIGWCIVFFCWCY